MNGCARLRMRSIISVSMRPSDVTSVVAIAWSAAAAITGASVNRFTSFTSGVTTVGFGPNVAASGVTVVSKTELTAMVTVDSTAALGWRFAYVNTGAEQLRIGFRIDGPAAPSIVAVSPSGAQQGQSLTVDITAANTHFDGTSQLILGAGVTVVDFDVTGPATATAVVAVSPTAPVGPNAVVVMTGSEVATGAGFHVARGPSSITAVTPDRVTQNQILNVALVGSGTHWLQGGSSADFGAGIVVNALTVTDPTLAASRSVVVDLR